VLLVDTCVWSLLLRRDGEDSAHTQALRAALHGGELVATTGLILQELLQGFPKDRDRLIEHLAALRWLHPDTQDHIDAADLHNNTCRRAGVQLGPIHAVIA